MIFRLADSWSFDIRKLAFWSGTFLIISALVLMLQNYIRYGANPGYDPSIAYVYLSVSVLGFLPFVFIAYFSALRLGQLPESRYILFCFTLILAIIGTFFIVSNIALHSLGYFDHWISARYARWYFGKEALFHIVLLSAVIYTMRKSAKKEKVIVAVHGRKEVIIKADVIEWIESDDHYLRIHTRDQSLMKRTTMEKMAAEFQPDFMRVHRKHIVNKQEVMRKEKAGRDVFLVLRTGVKVKVGRSYQPLEVLENDF